MQKHNKIYLSLLLFVALIMPLKAQLIQNQEQLANIDTRLKTQKSIAKNRYKQIFGVLESKLQKDEEQATRFLLAYLPLSDMADYDGTFFLDNARLSLKAKKDMPWGASIPEDIFLHFVLPVRVNNENLDSFRIVMYKEIYNRVKNLDLRSAALEVNHWCHEKVTYKGSDSRTSAPLSTVRTSFGRCGEESTLFVAALRTAGIPARQVYTPRWAHTDDNHAWVEIWVDGKWYFLGACEPSPELNMGWFAIPSTRTMLVNTRAYGWYNGSEPVITKADRFSELNLISNYTPSKTIYVKVLDGDNKPVANSKVEFQLYNYSEFFNLAKQFTDKNGIASFKTGLGDLMIWANQGDKFGFKKITVNETDTVKVLISDKFPKEETIDFDFVPPIEGKPVAANPSNIKENERRLLQEDSIRGVYMKTFLDSAKAKFIISKLGLKQENVMDLLIKSCGNRYEITKFLTDTKEELRPYAIKLLSAINEKDLHDTKAEILSDHLNNAMKYIGDYKNNEKLWVDYVLCGRIADEMMVAWRFIGDGIREGWKYSKEESAKRIAESGDKAPKKELLKFDYIYNLVLENIKIDSFTNAHSRAPLTPRGVFNLKVADPLSRDIFFVALARSLGSAARLNPETSIPQYWINSEWRNVSFENTPKVSPEKGFIHLNNLSSFDAKYYSNFTIELFRDGNYRTLEFEDVKPISAFADKIEVPAGKYLLVTGNRKYTGTVFGNMRFFEVKAKEVKNLDIKVRDLPKSNSVWAELKTENFNVKSLSDGAELNLAELTKKKPFIFAFIEPDKEPTKHVMVDLQPVKAELEKWGGSLIFILEKGKAQDNFNPDIFKNLPAQSIFVWDNDQKLIKYIESVKKLDLLGDFPIIITGDGDGRLDFFTKGYRIGIGDELVKEIKK